MLANWLHIDWDQFHFLRPEFLYLLIPILFILIIGLFSFRDEEKWKKSIAPHLRPYVIQKGSMRFRIAMHIVLSISLSIACLGLSGPTWNEIEVPGKVLETPVVIALDLSQSMLATDIQPNRLERAKFKILDLLKANPRARIALIGFSGTAHTIIPLCQDYHIIESHLEGLTPNVLPFSGTDLRAALDLSDSITQVSDALSQLILITDAIEPDLFTEIQRYIAQGNRMVELIPMNTPTGAEIPMPGSTRPFKDEKGQVVYSKLNSQVLKQLSSLENIHINPLTLDNSDVEQIAKRISSQLNFQEQDQKKENNWQDRGLILILPLTFFLLIWFRKGFVIYGFAFLFSLSSCDSNTQLKDWWYSKDYQGQQLENQGQFEKAGDTYIDPIRKGNAYYKAGNYEAAISAFSQDTTANGKYNLGLAYFKNGDYAAAQMAFGEAVEQNPEMNDAAKNQQLMGSLIDAKNEINPENAKEKGQQQQAQNQENKDLEDLSGGGQEATKEDMQRERKEETVSTDIRKAKELEEVPDNFEAGKSDNSQKVLMRKVNDDPSLFLKRKFKHEAKKKNLKPKSELDQW